MRQVICDICGCIQKIDTDLNHNPNDFIRNTAGKMPSGWYTIFVRKTVKKDGVVDLCSDCIEKYDAVHSAAQNTMDATVDSWMRIQLYNSKEDNNEQS